MKTRQTCLLPLAALCLGLLTATSAVAASVNVCINFAGSGIGSANRPAFVAAVQNYFNLAGLGPGDPVHVNVLNGAQFPSFVCTLSVTFVNNAQVAGIVGLNGLFGRAYKDNGTIFINVATFNTAGFPTAARRVQAMAETTAHEIGHALCAVHDSRGTGADVLCGPGGAVVPIPCSGGSRTLMTTGCCVGNPPANRGFVPPAPGSRIFSANSISQIGMGILLYALGQSDWEFKADFDSGILRLVLGQWHLQSMMQEDDLISFTYQILDGDENLFEFGWLNSSNDFVHPLPLDVNPDRLLEVQGGTYLHFALQGRPNSPLAGRIFPQKQFGGLTFLGGSNAPSRAASPGVDRPYYSQARIDFDVEGHSFNVLLDTGRWGADNGFYGTVPVPLTMTLVPTGSVWRYLDTGRDEGTAWRALNFDDSSWSKGPAQLGFGDGDEATVVNGGPANNRFITTYFRHTFPAPIPACSNLLLRVKRDDGAAVYLNGLEIFRSHMPQGAVLFETLASRPAVAGAEENAFFETNIVVTAALLRPGTNVLAVEIHQDVANSPDLSFDLELVGNVYPASAEPFVLLSAPRDDQSFLPGANIPLVVNDGDVFDPDGTVTRVEFFAEGELIGSDAARPFSMVWSNAPAGMYALNAVAYDAQGFSSVSTNEVNITVLPCIVLTCPPDIFLTTCSTGATANFSITGTNRCDTNLTITCRFGGVFGIPVMPATVFPPGTNTVVCTARDTVGHTTNCSFRVIVRRDTQPPQIRCPDDIVYLCSVAGTNVYYNVTATDDTDPNPVVTCVPPSGSYFPPGTNTVTCEARDSCGNRSRCSFLVIIVPTGFTKIVQAGVADNFLPAAFEAASPGPCLAGSGFWSGMPFDASWPGRQMAQSFQGLPNNISAAKLILHMKPTQAASRDDVLRLGLQNCGGAGVWAFSQTVESLPGAGGTWSANPPTLFTLDLAALPGGMNLLAQLNASHRLEFAVGTETMVDYARLEVTYCGPQSTLSGVPYSMSNVYPIHQGGGGVSWHTVNSNDPPTLEFDAGGADGLRFDVVDPGLDPLSPCQGTPISQYNGLLMNWPTGGETFALVRFIPGQAPEPFPDPTLISLQQIGNSVGRVVEVWNAGQFVSRYYVPGPFASSVIVPSSACLVQMGFGTTFFFAAFESAVPMHVEGQLVSGQAGPISGTAVFLYFVVTIDANANEPKLVRATLPPDGFRVSKMSLLRDDTWIDPFGPQLVSASDLVISTALIDSVLQPYGDCVNVGINGWNVELQNGLADFCEFDGQTVNCTPGHMDLTMYGMGQPEIKYGGLRLSLALSYPFDNCRIENTIPNAAPYSVVITRPAPATPITLNGVTNVETLHWPVKVSGGPGPQSWTVELPPATTVTAAGQTHNATHVTFLATPTMLDQFYRVCVQTMDSLQIVMKSLNVPPPNTPPPPPPCLALNCPSNVVVPGVSYAIGTVVTFNPTAEARCGSNVVITCVPPSGSVFAPGHTIVHCSAIDSLGNQDRCSFLVTVRDGLPPHLSIPGRLVVPCDGPLGAVVNFTSGAEDNLDPSPVVVCDPPTGTLFPPGTNLVVCVATDAAGNRSSMSFPVIVGGGCGTNRCIDITVPADIEVPCRTPGGANVTFIATARNTCTGGALAVTCTPASGSLFPVGLTRVVCTTTAGGSQSSATFLVEVTDVVPPQINCPSNIVAAAQSPLGAVVNYSASATDDCTPQPRLRCSPPSGSVFPVGDTRVLCEAADAYGNVDRCVFVVTVTPPRPFTAMRMDANRLELRWSGEAIVECTGTLDTGRWLRVDGTPTSNGVERVLILPADERQKFFRIMPLPLLPPADRDRDGVPDERDRCPDTPPGLPVDEFGCAPFDLVASPGLALGPEQEQLRKLRADLARWPSVADLADLVPNPDTHTSSVPVLLIRRELPRALVEQSNVVRRLDRALMDFLRVKGRRLVEIDQTTPPLDAEHADWRHEDDEILDLERIETALTDSLNQHQRAFLNLSNIVRATGSMPLSQRVQIASIDNVRGVATLTDGRRLLLPNPGTPAAPPFDSIRDAFAAGVEIDVEISQLQDGSLYGNFASSSTGVSGAVQHPRRLFLRITPVDFGLPDFGIAPRHQLQAYKWGFTETSSRHYFEFGQALVAVAALVAPGSGDYKHWLQIDEDSNNSGIYTTLVQKLDAASKPFVLKADRLPQFQAFNIRVREYRAPVLPNGNLGIAEPISEDFHLIELNPGGTYASAYYDSMVFTLDDSPSETRHRVARVNNIDVRFPLTLKPLNEMSFQGASYKATGNSSSYPAIQAIGFNDPFAVHFQDPNADVFFANPDDFDKGIVHPTLNGHNRNQPFSYRAKLPLIARDRLHDCGGGNTFNNPDTFYKIPFSGLYSVSQGNNGAFTHNGPGRYAWDFPRSAGAVVLTARGGTVIDLRESSSQSCYNSIAGDCVGCTGAASGNFVKIRHRDGSEALYAHFRLNGVLVSLNQRVYLGTPLGLVGTTGCSSGNHLHFEVLDPNIGPDTIPARFEAHALRGLSFDFEECFVPPASSAGASTQ